MSPTHTALKEGFAGPAARIAVSRQPCQESPHLQNHLAQGHTPLRVDGIHLLAEVGPARSSQGASVHASSDGLSLTQSSPQHQPRLVVLHPGSLLLLPNPLPPSPSYRRPSQGSSLIRPLNTNFCLRVCFLEMLTSDIPRRKCEVARPLDGSGT